MRKIDKNKIKTWFVTGASSGVGHEFCKLLLEQGNNVIAIARRTPQFSGENALCLSVDVTDKSAVENAIKQGIEQFGSIDVLVNNAGIGSNVLHELETLEHMNDVMNVNFFGTFNTINSILPYFRQQGYGTIINNTSMSGIAPRLWGSAYCSSKHAVEALSGVVKLEAQNFCRVMAFELGWFPGTEILKSALYKVPKDIPVYQNLKTEYNVKTDKKSIEKAVWTIIKVVKEEKKLPRHFMVGLDSIQKGEAEIKILKEGIKFSRKYLKQYSQYSFFKNFFQKVFSVKNQTIKGAKRKIITILGVKLKLKIRRTK